MLTQPYVSRRHLLGSIIATFAAGALAPRPSRAASTLALVDTVSGANFQAFWKTYLVPTISQKTGIDIKYTVGSGPPLQLQMQSWRDGEPGFSPAFFMDLDLANMVAGGNQIRNRFYPPAPREGNPQPEADTSKEYNEIDSGSRPARRATGRVVVEWRAHLG